MTYSEFKESFGILLNEWDTYDQLPPEGTAYPFVITEYTLLSQHQRGHRANAVRVLIDVWHNTTNSRVLDDLADKIAAKVNRVSNDGYYGIIESIKDMPTQEENLGRRQIVGNYTMVGGY